MGSLLGAFVLGIRDRHEENWMLVGDPEDARLLQIDYGYLLGEAPGGLALDTPRMTVQPSLLRLMAQAPGHADGFTFLDDFRQDLLTGYRMLRQYHPAFVTFCSSVLSNIYEPSQVQSWMWGKHVFRAGMAEEKALAWMEDKLRNEVTPNWVMKRGAKQAIVRAYYAAKSAQRKAERVVSKSS